MKKIAFLFLLLCACSPDKTPTVAGKTYYLDNTPIPITLSFSAHDHSYFGSAVNSYFGTYHQTDNTLTFTTLSSEMKSAPDDKLDAEHAYFTTLKSVSAYHLNGDILSLITPDGTTLTYHEQSTPF